MKFEEHSDYNRLKIAFNLLDNYDSLISLDIGCGGDAILEQQFVNHKIIGMDISLSALHSAKKNSPFSDFILADIKNLPIKNCCIDNVVMIAVLGGVSEGKEASVFRESNRVLVDEGNLILLVSQKRLPYSLLAPDRLFGGWKWRHFNVKLLQKQLHENSFNTNNIIFAGGLLSLFTDMIKFFWNIASVRSRLPPLPYLWINKLVALEFYPVDEKVKNFSRYIYIKAQKK